MPALRPASVRLRHARPPLLLLLVAAVVACPGPDPAGPANPPVASVRIQPSEAMVDIGDTIRFSATPRTLDNDVISDPDLTWRTSSAAATVDDSGLVTGAAPGTAEVEAVASNGVVGRAQLRVTPVAALEPDTGRYGQLVTVRGTDLPPDPTIYFTGIGERVRAETRTAGPDAVEVWVPVGAVDGPLELVWPGDSVVTSRRFRITAHDDIHAAEGDPAPLPFPYRNPALLASGSPRTFHFSVSEATPFALHLEDRGSAGEDAAVRAWLFRLDTEPATLVAFAMTRDHLNGTTMLDSVAYARAALPAGDYALLVAALDLRTPENADVRRPFGIRLSAETAFDRPPDGLEPNDFPAEAATLGLPFSGDGLGAENPYAMDHYAVEVTETATLTVAATAEAPMLLLFLFPEDQEDILAAWENDQVLAEADGAAADQQIAATVAPGRYTALVWDWGGQDRPYELSIDAAAQPAVLAGSPAIRAPDGSGSRASRASRTALVRALVTIPQRPER